MTFRVWVEDRPVGRLDKFERGSTFVYDADVNPADAISLTMPVRTASYDSIRGLLPVFDTNLPEGALRERIETGLRKAHGRVDPIDILRMTGRNQIGRITILPEGVRSRERRASIRNIDEILEQQATRALVEEIMTRYATRSGVSGAMPKILIEADSDAPRDPAEDHRQTIQTRDYILKFDAEDYPGLSLNEYHCLRAARAGGNDVAEARLNIDGRMLSVRRFDERDGTRLGFEDLASLNTKVAEDKYSGTIERDLFQAGRGILRGCQEGKSRGPVPFVRDEFSRSATGMHISRISPFSSMMPTRGLSPWHRPTTWLRRSHISKPT